jgi:tetratricopeptide (TPR) repeat protein
MRIMHWKAALALVTGAVLVGCAPTPPQEERSALDNPWHHYAQGMQALEEGDTAEGMRRFGRALEIDEEFSPALSGKALSVALRGTERGDEPGGEGYREADTERALETLKEARRRADDDTQRFIYETTAIRVLTALRVEDWLRRAEDHHRAAGALSEVDEQALVYYQNTDAADYFMGRAYYQARAFREAEAALARVLGARGSGKWQGPANRLYEKVQRIVRAASGHTLSDVAADIAVKEAVERADVAALLATELRLDSLFAGRLATRAEREQAPEFVPVDVRGHVFQREIETVLKHRVRGLESDYDASARAWLFRPAGDVTRKELALIFEDVLIKLSGDEGLATRMIGADHSPFPDVAPEAAWFNAVSSAVNRGLMQAELTGEFRPDDPADGPDLLLGVFKLRNVLDIR